MKKKLLRRIAAIASCAVLSAGACFAFAGCSSNNPEITITYQFNGKDYNVRYRLSRLDAPKTVTHFMELVEAKFYDGTCVHDYDSSYLRMGGYTLSESGEEAISPIDYFTKVKTYETENSMTFTQSVWKRGGTENPLYTVYGEFESNGNRPENGRQYRHEKGALVMDYTDKGKFTAKVTTSRNDGNGLDNDKSYKYNSATSLFYTYMGSYSKTLQDEHCVFGMAIDYEKEFQPLLDAISDYVTDHTDEEAEEEYSFTEEQTISNVNRFEQGDDPDFSELRLGDIGATYNTPIDAPIVIKKIKVNKY